MHLIIVRRIDNRLTEVDINFVSMIVIFVAAVIPVYIAIIVIVAIILTSKS
jgi:hypothetical protein